MLRVTMELLVRMVAIFLMLTCSFVNGTRYDIHYRPPPSNPSSYPPAPPPSASPLSIQGVTLCQQCSLVGTPSLAFSRPLQGATVQLVCRDYRYKAFIGMKTTTDSRGYFLFRLANFDFSKYDPIKACRAFIVSSPNNGCNVLSNINSGKWGAQLRKEAVKLGNEVLYSVGPFGFTPLQACKKSP